MPTIGWSESAPQNSDNLGLGAQEIRSAKTAIRTALDSEHVFPSTGGDAGTHRLGSARAFVGSESAVSSAGTDGRLMIASNTSRLFGVGSGGTMFLGGANSLQILASGGAADLLLNNGTALLPQTHYWALQAQRVTLGSGGSVAMTFTSAYSGAPALFLSIVSALPVGLSQAYAAGVTGSGASIYGFSGTGALAANNSVYVLSIGSRVLG